MLSVKLQIILIVLCVCILILFIRKVQKFKLELKYALIWILVIMSSLILAIFPGILNFISALLYIKEPVNALFLVAIIFMLMIMYSLTSALSKASGNIKVLSQEVGLLKKELEELKNVKNTEK
ncbi:DUF2304 domain-containing protein [Paenibacillus macerans]|uniref:DUF2304 domain-containing protein n=1 Tax=Paenibacillus macerans TaxID=44252 RepID=UPI0022E2091D|nr:DUF2304 domain-containing protein [Paenibacillus macerans]